MPAPQAILELVQRFQDNQAAYKSPKYNETQLRREFLDPFFEALGWDMNNRKGYAEAYKDVVHEDSVEVEGQPRRRITPSASGGRASSSWKPRNRRSTSRRYPPCLPDPALCLVPRCRSAS